MHQISYNDEESLTQKQRHQIGSRKSSQSGIQNGIAVLLYDLTFPKMFVFTVFSEYAKKYPNIFSYDPHGLTDTLPAGSFYANLLFFEISAIFRNCRLTFAD